RSVRKKSALECPNLEDLVGVSCWVATTSNSFSAGSPTSPHPHGFSTEDPKTSSLLLQPLILHPTAIITLDPDTAHPDLILSEDLKSVKRGEGQRDLPDNPERFAYWPFVLGQQSFSAGRHCWEVEVGDEGDWAIGVARESIPRKGQLNLCPKGGIWGVEKWGGQVRALTTHKVTLLALRWVPRRVSIHLDYIGGTVAFFDADEGGLIFVFSHCWFSPARKRGHRRSQQVLHPQVEAAPKAGMS
uniref:B30.2/SPRY domain-containing protein n=1 Tax=Coturnix japonica TaxID=93934 RepID=A0A8C2TYA1_COTJA